MPAEPELDTVFHYPPGSKAGIGVAQIGKGRSIGREAKLGLACGKVGIAPAGPFTPSGHVAAHSHIHRAERPGKTQLPEIAGAAQQESFGRSCHDQVLEIQHLSDVVGGVDIHHRLRQRPVVHFVERRQRGALAGGIDVIVDVDRLQPARAFGHLKGFNNPLEAVVRPPPVVGIDVLVLVGCVHLEIAALVLAQRRHCREAGIAAGNQRLAAVHVQEAAVVGEFQGPAAGCRVAAPEHDAAGLAGRAQATHVGRGARHFPLNIEDIAGNLQVVSLVCLVHGFRGAPYEGMGKRMACRLDVRQREDASCDAFQRGALFGVQSVCRDLSLDDRHGGGNAVFLQDFSEQRFAGYGASGQFGGTGKAVAVHMHQHQAAAVFAGGIGHRHGRQRQRAGEELDGIDDPARLLALRFGEAGDGIARQRITTPIRIGHWVVAASGRVDNPHQRRAGDYFEPAEALSVG